MILKSFFGVLAIFLCIIPHSYGLPRLNKLNRGAPVNSQFEAVHDLFQPVALVTKENRTPRGDYLGELETSQGRIWCFQKYTSGRNLSAEEIKRKADFASVATLFLDKNTILLNRHMFIRKSGSKLANPENCFFEHISSGELIQLTKDAQYEPYQRSSDKDDTSFGDEDLALVRLSKAPDAPNVHPIKRSEILIDPSANAEVKLTVVSNFAANAPDGKRETLTITTCKPRNTVVSNKGSSPQLKTDCNTGQGSSGSNVFVTVGESKMLYGIIISDTQKKVPGSGYDPNKLSTSLVRFRSNIFKLYEQLSNYTKGHDD